MQDHFSVKRITDALAEVDKARNEADSAKATYKAKREILKKMQNAMEDAIRAECSPAPLFDGMRRVVDELDAYLESRQGKEARPDASDEDAE